MTFRLTIIFAILASFAVDAAQPNVVLILSDDTSWYGTSVRMDADRAISKGPYRRTPQLARMASEGMTFSRAYAAAGMCAPARCSLQTGMSAARTRFSGNGGFGDSCPTTVEYDMRSKNAGRAMIEPAENWLKDKEGGTNLRQGGSISAAKLADHQDVRQKARGEQ